MSNKKLKNLAYSQDIEKDLNYKRTPLANAILNTALETSFNSIEIDTYHINTIDFLNSNIKDINKHREINFLTNNIDMLIYFQNSLESLDELTYYTGLSVSGNTYLNFLYIPIHSDFFNRKSIIEESNKYDEFSEEKQLNSIAKLIHTINNKCSKSEIEILPIMTSNEITLNIKKKLKQEEKIKKQILNYCKEENYQGIVLTTKYKTIELRNDLENEVKKSIEMAQFFEY
jgi:hypothetical protein